MKGSQIRLVRVTTVASSMNYLLRGQLAFMKSKGFDITAVCADGDDLKEVEKREGVNIKPIRLTRQITPFKDIISLYRIYLYCRKYKPQIIHSHTPKAGLLSMLAGFLARVPIRMHTVAGMPLMEEEGAKRKLLLFTERLTYRMANYVYPNSFNLEQYIIEHIKVNPAKVKVIGHGSSNGIDCSVFKNTPEITRAACEVRTQLGINKNAIVFSFVGRLVIDKGIRELVKAFCALNKEIDSEMHLLLVGPYEEHLNPLDEETLRLIKQEDTIHTVGFQKDVKLYLAVSNIFVFPSYREGLPNVLLQAGAMGLPSIVTNISGSNEIITHMENGLIVPAKDVDGLRHAMHLLFMDRSLYSSLQSFARKAIVEKYDQEYLWHKILEEYQKHLKSV